METVVLWMNEGKYKFTVFTLQANCKHWIVFWFVIVVKKVGFIYSE